MTGRNAMVEHCLELLAPLGTPRARPMFGGHGLSLDGHFMALIAFDRLYLKTDALTRPHFAEAGCKPFVYQAKDKAVTMSYWTVPAQALESPGLMRPWARLALEAALRAKAPKSTAVTPKAAALRRKRLPD